MAHKLSLAVLVGATLSAPVCADEDLGAGLTRILVEHNLARSVDNDVAAAREQVRVDRSALFPRVGIRANVGSQHINRDSGGSGTFNPTEGTLFLNQLLFDFGVTKAAINRSRQNLTKEEYERETQRINLVLSGIDAHLKLLRAQIVLDYATQSEGNVKTQAGLESIRVEAGKGYSTDVLQAKSQLAAAQARRVLAQGSLETAVNRYKAVFGEVHMPAGRLRSVIEPVEALPGSLDEALQRVSAANPDVLAANARADLSARERDFTRRKEFMPRIDIQAESGQRRDYEGASGQRRDDKIVLQTTWSFDLGMRASAATAAASYAAISEREKALYALVQANEEVRNAWSDHTAAKDRLQFLRDQVQMAKGFLDLARKERELGRRSLLDVLNGETNLINAQSDAAAARADLVLAAFRLLRATGSLAAGAVTEGQIEDTASTGSGDQAL